MQDLDDLSFNAGAALADDLADLLNGGKLRSTVTPLPV
jgi:hypothetical protein